MDLRNLVRVVLVVGMLAGCGNGTQPDEGLASKAEVDFTGEPLVIESEAYDTTRLIDVPLPSDIVTERFPFTEPMLINDGAGVRNPGFKQAFADYPLYWNCPPEKKHYVRRVARGESKVASSTDFDLLMVGRYGWNSVRQEVWIPASLADRVVEFTALAKGPKNSGVLVFIIGDGQGQTLKSRRNEDSGEWNTLQIGYRFPKEFPGRMITIGFSHAENTKEKFLFRDPKLSIL